MASNSYLNFFDPNTRPNYQNSGADQPPLSPDEINAQQGSYVPATPQEASMSLGTPPQSAKGTVDKAISPGGDNGGSPSSASPENFQYDKNAKVGTNFMNLLGSQVGLSSNNTPGKPGGVQPDGSFSYDMSQKPGANLLNYAAHSLLSNQPYSTGNGNPDDSGPSKTQKMGIGAAAEDKTGEGEAGGANASGLLKGAAGASGQGAAAGMLKYLSFG